MEATNVLHHLPLSSRQWGGVEVQFAYFLEATRADPRLANFLSIDSRALPRQYEALSHNLYAEGFDPRRWHGLTLPKAFRLTREARQARDWGVDVVLNTNLLGSLRSLRVAQRAKAAAVYWERGAAWFPREKPLSAEFRGGHDLVMSNSLASAQMLREVWSIEAPIEVCSPCIWTMPAASGAGGRTLPENRPLQVGFAARLRAFKGGVLAVHAVHELVRRGIDVELVLAGEGPDKPVIEATARSLGIAARVRCLGHVDEMKDFYASIDLLLHPALREPYGNVCAEAAVAGVPTVTTLVDGLPEVVEHGVSGICVTPDMVLSQFASFGGDPADVYPVVYKPDLGKVGEPGFASPGALADAVVAIAGTAETYADFSRRAKEGALQRHSPVRHVDRLVELMRRASQSRG